ncbi:MAG: 4-(cytidine 5'-diphospho)-2-C-methyl-D-erythritol kinase [Aphanocapsa feldmannii 277cV]|uniref:4-diphosphocytidyl-2-C-methyl-D-erythritol kinase n=2 Tax=Aphanocapsa feldmannii TaxID=192050 RepID=A0A524RPW9_9CHRO|nr:MAG: 4-(cytidine 5'-diphospho)-2-C-methyl-D-erythritol kinase [Aphanocapsa feldmannii 288cV]TGG93819.1 MAG: 4-(cytidine 5'-diphospho)-2-C-methyl-D-erythritol kinase [Aphanocapsa feldmannii 277cV]TGH19180.1 MAG: 4-(cytidine 5'-diphospho)-2-C-methyl-D-erythritol kinase [Aphanocapsa feldmannii 277cI]
MSSLRLRSPAKVNLHLEVLGLRGDGFHELAMVMQSIDLADELCLSTTAASGFRLCCDVAEVPLDRSNLVLRAAERLATAFPQQARGVLFELTKRIPIGAGLAGGSSNAAAALVGLNHLWGLGLTLEQLQPYAAALGSDISFCLAGGTQLCFGRGERLEPVEPLQRGAIVLLKHPEVAISTPWAYGLCREQLGHRYLQGECSFAERRMALRRGPLLAGIRGDNPAAVATALRNDLEAPVCSLAPSVEAGLQLLRSQAGVLGACMSGSGPSHFALFRDRETARATRRHLQPELDRLGLKSWVCGFLPRGITTL